MQTEKITNTQIILLISSLKLTFAFFSSVLNSPPANQDIWIALLGSIPYVLLFFSPLFYLSRKFPNRSLWDYSEQITGKFFSKIIILIYISFFSALMILLTANFTVFVGSCLMPETPAYLFEAFFIIPCAYAAYHGILTIARTGQILLPVAIAFILITFGLGIQYFDFKVLLPIFKDSSFFQINTGAYAFALCAHDGILFFLMPADLHEKKIEKPFFIALLISTLLHILITLAPFMTLGIEQAKHANYPYYVFSRQIITFDFIERIEAFILTSWIMIELFKLSVYLYFSAKGLHQLFKTISYKKFIVPLSFSIFFIALLPQIYAIDFLNNVMSINFFPKVSIIPIFIIPFLLCAVYFIKKI